MWTIHLDKNILTHKWYLTIKKQMKFTLISFISTVDKVHLKIFLCKKKNIYMDQEIFKL